MEAEPIEMNQKKSSVTDEKNPKNSEMIPKNSDSEKNSTNSLQKMRSSTKNSLADWLTLVLLTSVNMLNYMDRTLLAGEIWLINSFYLLVN